MDANETPKKCRLLEDKLTIPASPFMKCLGFGTGVSVYKFNRSPVSNAVRSPWAVKKINVRNSATTATNRLRHEAIILRKLNHPNIVGFRAVVKDTTGKMCLAMEACTTSLGDMIENRNEEVQLPFPARDIAHVAYDIAKALNYLHNQVFILHCDIKSYNVLVQGNFVLCKLCDFGISLPLKSDGTVDPDLLKSEYLSLGTLPWMAPETLLYNVLTTKSDVYSYGLVIWEMIALTIPPPQEDTEYNFNILEYDASDTESDTLKCMDWRPDLPAHEFSGDYDNILEIFYNCTEKNSIYRPNAELLEKVTDEILKKLTYIN